MTDVAGRLARAISQRRAELGFTRADVQMRSRRPGYKGVSQEAIRAIERGERERIHTATASGLERGLDWPPGYIYALVNDQPLPAPEDRPEPEPEPEPEEGLAARLEAIETAVGIRPMTDREAMRSILRFLTDDQYRTVATAVAEDPRYHTINGP